MAASGIAEHNEARRKEMCMQKQAFKRKNMMMQMADRYGENPDLLNQDTYEQEVNSMRRVGSPPGRAGPPDSVRHDAAYVDQMRRNELRQQQLVEYSAKIPNRYSAGKGEGKAFLMLCPRYSVPQTLARHCPYRNYRVDNVCHNHTLITSIDYISQW